MFLLLIIAAFDPIHGELFNNLYFNHSKKLYGIIYNMVKHREDTEDILQDTYRKVYMNIKRFQELDNDLTIKLLVIYAKNTAKDFLRKRSNCKTFISLEYESDLINYNGEESESDFLIDNILLNKEKAIQVAAYVDRLVEPQRHAILLKFTYEMKNKEISKTLNISETAVSSRINRAKDLLKKMMEEDKYEQFC